MPNYDIEATKAKVFSKIGLFSMNGRRNRKKYFLLNWLLAVLEYYLTQLTTPDSFLILSILLPLLYISFNNTAKRFQDLNRSGWFATITLLPFITGLFANNLVKDDFISLVIMFVSLYLTFFKGTTGPNFYGPDPLDAENLTSTNQEAQLDHDNP